MGRVGAAPGHAPISIEQFRTPKRSETVLVSLAAPSLGYKESVEVSISAEFGKEILATVIH